MSHTHVKAFDSTIQTTNRWLHELEQRLGWDDRQRAYQAMRAVLHALRDCLSVDQAAALGAQAPERSLEPIRIGPGVTPPRLISKIEPDFTPEARANNVQGAVLLQVVVDENGRAVDISVISPLGFGLDEQAEAAIASWRFRPGMKDGVPVRVLATVEVNFRLLGVPFDSGFEKRRTTFNTAVQTINKPNSDPAAVERAVQSMMRLAHEKFAPAMYLAGTFKIKGEHVPKDEDGGLDLIQKAAAKHYGPAVYELAMRRIEGRGTRPDIENGIKEMRSAATLGSGQAQFYLAQHYEAGEGVPRDLDSARRYYRLCAAQGVAVCQYRLGRLLYDAPARRERDYVQSVALFELAAEQGLAEANEAASNEVPKLTLEQSRSVEALKRQIVRK